jgi:hypothetical protein
MRSGRTLTVCPGDEYTRSGEESEHAATDLTTMIGVEA